jgi:hypothetical protein
MRRHSALLGAAGLPSISLEGLNGRLEATRTTTARVRLHSATRSHLPARDGRGAAAHEVWELAHVVGIAFQSPGQDQAVGLVTLGSDLRWFTPDGSSTCTDSEG